MKNIEIEGLTIPYLSGQLEYSEVLWKDRDWSVKMRVMYSLPLTVVLSVWKFFEYDKEKAIETFDKINKISRQENSFNMPK